MRSTKLDGDNMNARQKGKIAQNTEMRVILQNYNEKKKTKRVVREKTLSFNPLTEH